jgi:hypothetical protein
MEWKNVTETFSEKQRHYNGKYLEISRVYDNKVEVSLFSSPKDSYEIYFCYDIMHGIIYVEKEKSDELYKEIIQVLEAEYKKHKKATGEFIDYFCGKYKVCLPSDMYFNTDELFNML